ncbi:sulfite exporter TauE/SafE family protein [Algoriphagus sp. AGSA1]|uniref:sulfite exporter TauE/SafE family protein n=1 Tax=Algoriphagus sp. AGSA1 TaxID=2907213 RepID=UPI001F4733E3|nr:sulfite exporter TauE/SafE family protein [Algoriphagus sp. AGSA1]MCE7054841.1 sulfite exporter TauE/SafE family protein [Algoriphagus sp. AGSA1]
MLWTAFLLGFLGAFHCVGMCGPIALAVSSSKRNVYFYHKILYNLGRSTTYAALGLLVGSIGFTLSLAGVQQIFSIAMGVLILIVALFYNKADLFLSVPALSGIILWVKKQLGRFIKAGGSFAFFATGLANGLLPCGMVYMALIAALAFQSPILGAAYMFVFGLGTIPLLLVMMYSGRVFSVQVRQKFQKAIPYLGVVIGILFIFRGLGFGMFYSPDLVVFDYGAQQFEVTLCR